MALYAYRKAPPHRPLRKRLLPYLPYLLSLVGLLTIFNAVWPLLSYRLSARRFSPELIAPIPNFTYRPPTTSSSIVLGVDDESGQYLQPENWFVNQPNLEPKQSQVDSYNLSIPTLKIKQAIVKIGQDDLSKSLIQQAGTALPGQVGNTVVFGHSVLPQFFSPTNYKRIFSTLPTIDEGDDILVDFDGVTYRYRVIQKLEVMPEDVSVLTQPADDSYLSLITCVPPGTYLRRLVVRARLVAY